MDAETKLLEVSPREPDPLKQWFGLQRRAWLKRWRWLFIPLAIVLQCLGIFFLFDIGVGNSFIAVSKHGLAKLNWFGWFESLYLWLFDFAISNSYPKGPLYILAYYLKDFSGVIAFLFLVSLLPYLHLPDELRLAFAERSDKTVLALRRKALFLTALSISALPLLTSVNAYNYHIAWINPTLWLPALVMSLLLNYAALALAIECLLRSNTDSSSNPLLPAGLRIAFFYALGTALYQLAPAISKSFGHTMRTVEAFALLCLVLSAVLSSLAVLRLRNARQD